ncbi:MAG: crossover junction endodeoxyribonuclease RuvC [Phascolarctobacterium sp.]|nr:crossover junction endodeoxyribonuclease RuvC [Phascolarctobacterium sp.]
MPAFLYKKWGIILLVLGIDPGTAICGYGLVDVTGNRLKALHYGAVVTEKDMAAALRLKKIYDALTSVIEEYKPDIMSIEQLFFNRNVTTAIAVGQARGVAMLTAANKGIPVLEFTPIQIKQAVTGTGSADKEQVTFMVQRLLNIREKPRPDDVADALAIAICGAHTASTLRWQELI